MGEPIKIIVTAETQQAADALKTFLANTGSGLKGLKAGSAESGEELKKLREASMLTREGFHGLETSALLLGATRFPELGEAIMGVRLLMNSARTTATLLKITLAEVALPLTVIAAGVAAGVYTWNEYANAQANADAETKKLLDSLDKVPALLKKISDYQKTGLISPAAASEFADYLGKNPKRKLYVQPDGTISPNPTEQVEVGDFAGPAPGVSVRVGSHFVTKDLPQATPEQANKYAEENLPAAAEQQMESDVKYREVAKKITDESLAGLDAEIQKIREKHEAERDELTLAQKSAGNLMSGAQTQALMDQSHANEQREVAEAEAKDAVERLKRDQEWAKAYSEAQAETLRQNKENKDEEERVTAELLKQIQLKQEIARSDAAVKLRTIQENPLLSNAQKQKDSIPAIQALMAANEGTIASRQDTVDTTKDETARLEALRQINELKLQQVDLDHQLYEASNVDNFAAQLQKVVLHFQNLGTFAQQAAGIIQGTLTNVVNGLAGAFTNVIMGTQTAAQAFASFGQQALASLINMIVTAVLYAEVALPILTALGVLTAGATAASGATVTVAAVIGAQASIMGGAAFEEGGYTFGKRGQAAGIVHGEEYVFSAPAVDRIGVDNLDAMHQGRGGGGSMGRGGKTETHNFIHFDKTAMLNDIAKSDAFEINVVDIMQRNAHKIR